MRASLGNEGSTDEPEQEHVNARVPDAVYYLFVTCLACDPLGGKIDLRYCTCTRLAMKTATSTLCLIYTHADIPLGCWFRFNFNFYTHSHLL